MICMVVPEGEDEPHCPARAARVPGGVQCEHCGAKHAHYRVTYYGWTNLWDECVPETRIRPPSSQCARLMAEADALSGLFPIPPTGFVRHIGAAVAAADGRHGAGTDSQEKHQQPQQPPPPPQGEVARVVDRSVRQVRRCAANMLQVKHHMQVMFYLEHVCSTPTHPDGWYAADTLQATSRLATGLHIEFDVGERWAANEAACVRLRLDRKELWVCACDFVRWATHGAMTKLPSQLGDASSQIHFGTSSAKAFPVSVLGSVLRCLPLQHARRHRQSGDHEWFRGLVAAELSVINCASVLTPRTVPLPPRVETLRHIPGGVPTSITVHVIQGAQPRKSDAPLTKPCRTILSIGLTASCSPGARCASVVDASDFLQLVGRQRKRYPSELVDQIMLCIGPEARAALPALVRQKLVLPADVCGRALDMLVGSASPLSEPAALFKSSSAWAWLTGELAQLTDPGALPSPATATACPRALVAAAVADDATACAGMNGQGYEPVSWAEVASERGLGERLSRPVWSRQAELGLPKCSTKVGPKYVWAASERDFYMKEGVRMADIERVLDPTNQQGHNMEELVGIGRITDPDHPALRYHSGSSGSSAFCLYARRDLAPFTVVGEYVGDILTDMELNERQDSREDDKTDNYSLVIYRTTERYKKSRGATIWTADRTNELIFANDWREDVLNIHEDECGGDAEEGVQRRRQNLNPVEVVSTEDGKPHILYVVGEDPVPHGAELFIDYGQEYWTHFRSEFRWLAKLKVVEDALAQERKLRRVAERRVEELKAAAGQEEQEQEEKNEEEHEKHAAGAQPSSMSPCVGLESAAAATVATGSPRKKRKRVDCVRQPGQSKSEQTETAAACPLQECVDLTAEDAGAILEGQAGPAPGADATAKSTVTPPVGAQVVQPVETQAVCQQMVRGSASGELLTDELTQHQQQIGLPAAVEGAAVAATTIADLKLKPVICRMSDSDGTWERFNTAKDMAKAKKVDVGKVIMIAAKMCHHGRDRPPTKVGGGHWSKPGWNVKFAEGVEEDPPSVSVTEKIDSPQVAHKNGSQVSLQGGQSAKAEKPQAGWKKRLSSESDWLAEGEAQDVFTGCRLREHIGTYVTRRENETPKQLIAQLSYDVSLLALLEVNNVRLFGGNLKASSKLRKHTKLLIPGCEGGPQGIMEGTVVATKKDDSLWMVAYDAGDVMELEASEVRKACWCHRVYHEGWVVAASHPFAGALLRRVWPMVDGTINAVNGYIAGYLPPGDNTQEDLPFWHAMNEDGDDEDLNETELKEAIRCRSEWASQQQQQQQQEEDEEEKEPPEDGAVQNCSKRAAPATSSSAVEKKRRSSEVPSTGTSDGCKLQLGSDSDAGSDIGDLASLLSVTSDASEVGCAEAGATDSLHPQIHQHKVLRVRHIDQIVRKRVVAASAAVSLPSVEYLVTWADSETEHDQTWESPATLFSSGHADMLKAYDPIAVGVTAPCAGSVVEVDFTHERAIGVVQKPTGDETGKVPASGRSFSVFFPSDGSTFVVKLNAHFFRKIECA